MSPNPTKYDKTTNDGSPWLGAFWLFGALFTVGYAKLNIFQAVLCLFAWPYYVGSYLAP